MTTQIIETNTQSGNSAFINKIPIQSDPPKDGEFVVYNEEDNQWKFEKQEKPADKEYMQVVNTGDRNFLFNITAVPKVIKFDKIITDLTPRDISFDISSSTWTLQSGTYQLTAYFPSIIISVSTNVIATSTFKVYWKNLTDNITLDETGFIWLFNPAGLSSRETVYSSTIDTIVKITQPTMFRLFIEPDAPADISLTIGYLGAGYSSVMIKTL